MSKNVSLVVRILFIVFSVLLCASFARIAFSGQVLTFSAFLDLLSTSSIGMFNSALVDFTIYGDWGLFDGLRQFLNIFTGLFSVIVFLIYNLLQVLNFILNFVKYLFLGY